jgi:leucyl/phenylalanyl-tRNA--protein transferase
MPVFRLDRRPIFPPPELADEEGLLAVGGDLAIERLLAAYANGIFPWYEPGGPILWWSPDPRLVLFPDELHVSRRLARTLRSGRFTTTRDAAFPRVIRACAEAERPDQPGTWITPEMQRAYIRLHEAGFAHSVETWRDDNLVGGIYGVRLGRTFFGESMFHAETDASKVALVALVDWLKSGGIGLIDCQVSTPHMLRMGAREVPRAEFLRRVEAGLMP